MYSKAGEQRQRDFEKDIDGDDWALEKALEQFESDDALQSSLIYDKQI